MANGNDVQTEDLELNEIDDATPGPDDTEDVDDAIKDGEETSVEDTPQFKGLLRDKQTAVKDAATARAEAAAANQRAEEAERKLAEAQQPKEAELDEFEAAQPVSKGELKAITKKLAGDVLSAINERDREREARNLKHSQSLNAREVTRRHTVKSAGKGLDAATVVDAAYNYLMNNRPEKLQELQASPTYIEDLYEYGLLKVPQINARYKKHMQAEAIREMGEGGAGGRLPPSGGGRGLNPEDSLLHDIMSGDIPEEEINKMLSETGY